MNTKKIIFSIIAVLILLTSSVGIYFSYDFIETDNQKNIDFSKNQILYDILDTIYPVSFQLDNIGKKKEFLNILPQIVKLVMNFIKTVFYIIAKSCLIKKI